MSKKTIFKGSGVALITPMNPDGTVNYETLDELLEFQIENKTDAIVITGTTGEASTLSDKEHIDVIEHTVQTVSYTHLDVLLQHVQPEAADRRYEERHPERHGRRDRRADV